MVSSTLVAEEYQKHLLALKRILGDGKGSAELTALERSLKTLEVDLNLKTAVLENSLNGFDIVDETGKFVYVNESYAKMWG